MLEALVAAAVLAVIIIVVVARRRVRWCGVVRIERSRYIEHCETAARRGRERLRERG